LIVTLDQIPVGKTGLICKITTDYVTKERLESLGVIDEVEIEVMRESPLGRTRIYKCLNTLIALRNDIAEKIYLEVANE
jgi:Fe2+ transport system protein FeoA